MENNSVLRKRTPNSKTYFKNSLNLLYRQIYAERMTKHVCFCFRKICYVYKIGLLICTWFSELKRNNEFRDAPPSPELLY